MGRNFSLELSEAGVDLHTQIRTQLTHNHYPPVPTSMVEPCIEAIGKCNDDEQFELVDLPEGVTWRGRTQCPAYAIVEAHHLKPWLNQEEDEEVFDETK